MPLKKLKSVVKSIAKPFKKVLRSPIGKAALLYAGYKFGPMAFQGSNPGGLSGLPGWKKVVSAKAPWLYSQSNIGHSPDSGILANLASKWRGMGTLGKAATIGGATMAAGAIGDDVIDEKETVIDTSGHEGYLKARKNFVDEWADWYMQQGDDEETAYAKASEAMFNNGGIVGLAQGGRIGMQGGGKDAAERSFAESAYAGDTAGFAGASRHGFQGERGISRQERDRRNMESIANVIARGNQADQRRAATPVVTPKSNWLQDLRKNSMLNFVSRNKYKNLKNVNPQLVGATAGWKGLPGEILNALNPPDEVEDYDIDSIREIAATHPGLSTLQTKGLEGFRKDLEAEEAIKANPTQTTFESFYDLNTTPPSGGDGSQQEWQRLGYPSYEAYLAAMQGLGGKGAAITPTDTVGDYYGFQEWQDWDPNNTAPLFGDATQYKALLNKGGRIGLYAGGMGGMNNPMNPMMNRGLGAMGSPGMNPFNQQNLMAQAQMRGNPMMGGNPMMAQRPGIAAQGPGISGTQAAAKMAKKEDDGELLKLIRMLASMGIPMEQLRGRTKEELVEMAISLQKDQPRGRPEVVEESEEVEEEVMTAANGGRIGYAGGTGEYGEPRPMGNPAVVEEIDNMREFIISNPGIEDVADYSKEYEEDEEEEYVDTRAGGGLMRTRYAMGSEQPIIPSKDGPQLDFRNTGGYQPHGKAEKHDDVRALLAQGEFVVTSGAVKGIGGGDRDLGAKRMYDMMHKYEPIGRALS